MLYQLHEMNHAALQPARMMMRTMQSIYSNPWMPHSYTGFGKAVAASAEIFERVTRQYAKPHFDIGHIEIDGKHVRVRERKIRHMPFCDLLHFERDVDREDPKVLVVAPMSGHYATLLRGTVEGLLPDHDVYITDWINARDIPTCSGHFDLDDYINLIIDYVHALGPNVHLLAVCQPSVPVLAACSIMAAQNDPDQALSMTLMGGPIDTRLTPTEVNDFAAQRTIAWFKKNVVHKVPPIYSGKSREVYPGFLQLTGFMSMNMDRHVNAHLKLYEHLIEGDGDSAEQHRAFYDEYLSVMDLPAEFYLQTIETVFQKHSLPEGTMISRNRKVNPGAITQTALLTVEGEKDDITGRGQTEAAHRLCENLPEDKRRHFMAPKVGHYGIFNGRRWREEILPHVRDFIRSHEKRTVMDPQGPRVPNPGGMGDVVRRLREMLPSQVNR